MAGALTDRQLRRAAVLDDPRFEYLRNATVRRRLAYAAGALQALQVVLFLALDSSPWVTVAGSAVVMPAFIGVFGLLQVATRGVESLPEGALDERKQQVKGEVYALAYRIGVGLLAAAVVLTSLWLLLDLPVPGVGVLVAAVVAPFQLSLLLHSMVAALRSDTPSRN